MDAIDLSDYAIPPAWWRAMEFFKDGDPSKVAELLLSGEEQTKLVHEFLADVVTGKLKPPTVGKARRVLTVDHRKMIADGLRRYQSLDPGPLRTRLDLLRDLTVEERKFVKWWFEIGRDDEKNSLIAEVAELSGASVYTVRDAWKKAAAPSARIRRNNRDISKKIALRTLARKNDPFGR